MISVRSYDVFDTCLTRVCGIPENVFYLMACNELGLREGSGEAHTFVNNRINAEASSRTKASLRGLNEVRLEDIYENLRELPKGWSRSALIELELTWESRVLQPVKAILDEITGLRSGGARIIYVSDMYLPAIFVKRQLVFHGFWEQGDMLYLSCEHNCTKFTGELFSKLLADEHIMAGDLLHSGDHPHSDVLVPARMGIKTRPVQHAYNRFEALWNEQSPFSRHSKEILLMAGLSKSSRLQRSDDVYVTMVASVIAPIFVPFVSHILEDAERRSIRKLYFQARDGYVFYLIAKELLGENSPIQVSYLYGSRRCFYLPGLRAGDHDHIRHILKGALGRTPAEMLTRLGLSDDFLDTHLERLQKGSVYKHTVLTREGVNDFEQLLCEEGVFAALLEKAVVARQLVLEYFKQEGLCGNENIGIVDVGWSAVSLQSVKNILGKENVFGYFFAVFKDRVINGSTIDYDAVYYPEQLSSIAFDDLFLPEIVAMLEQFFLMTTEPSTIGFQKDGDRIRPLFGRNSHHHDRFVDFLLTRDSMITAFARNYKMLGGATGNTMSVITITGRLNRLETILYCVTSFGL